MMCVVTPLLHHYIASIIFYSGTISFYNGITIHWANANSLGPVGTYAPTDYCNGIEDLYWESYFRCCILSLCVCWLAAMIARYYRFEQQANRMYLIGIDWIIDIIALDYTTG